MSELTAFAPFAFFVANSPEVHEFVTRILRGHSGKDEPQRPQRKKREGTEKEKLRLSVSFLCALGLPLRPLRFCSLLQEPTRKIQVEKMATKNTKNAEEIWMIPLCPSETQIGPQ